MIQAVIQILINDTRVKDSVGANKANTRYKVFPVVADQDEQLPFTVGSILSNEPQPCKGLTTVQDKVRFQLATYSSKYEEMDKIDNAIRFSIDGFDGLSAGIELDIWFDGHRDAFDNAKQAFARVSEFYAFVKRNVD